MPKKHKTSSKGNENNPNNFFNTKEPYPRGGRKQNDGNKTRAGSQDMHEMRLQLDDLKWLQSTNTRYNFT